MHDHVHCTWTDVHASFVPGAFQDAHEYYIRIVEKLIGETSNIKLILI